ncbi:sulfite oxidase, mitochondrial precursor [Purpureocillium lavendulum]|uniref:Sulfite oxidase, mitochondrial n=1 Tax=Purpureocillium lavendulum TaxID=1247861 RepID=A0AB34G393_9HYPO|nr:sulfite oxidase, mitochondrial precursor [Purpureocillium lavendulum]
MDTRPLCLLALDGGGIRGLSELVVFEEIMNRIKHDLGLDEDPVPAEFFDLVGGTSTGGLIVLLLGRLRLSVPQARKEYICIAEEVFSLPRFSRFPTLRKYKFDGRKLEGVAAAKDQPRRRDDVGTKWQLQSVRRQTLALRREALGHKHPDTLRSMHSLAMAIDKLGKYEEAEAMNRETLALRREALSDKHPT